MIQPQLCECCFIDGPYRGMTKPMEYGEFSALPTYDVLLPKRLELTMLDMQELRDTGSIETKCYRVQYVYQELPTSTGSWYKRRFVFYILP